MMFIKQVSGRTIKKVTIPSYLTANKTGMYMVTYSLTAWNGMKVEDFATILYLRRNGNRVPGTKFDADVDLTGIQAGLVWVYLPELYPSG